MDARSRYFADRLKVPMLVAAGLVIPSVVIDVNDFPDPWSAIGFALNVGIWVAFLFEFTVMMLVVPDRTGWIRTHKLETFLVVVSMPVLPVGLASLRLVRLLRITRLARLAKLSRETFSLRGLPYVALLTFLLVIAAGSAFVAVEPGRRTDEWDGIWWALTTVSTVGYGDVSPTTDAGRLIALFVIFLGIGFVAMLTAAVAQHFIATELGGGTMGSSGDDRSNARHTEIVSHLGSIDQRLGALEAKRHEVVGPD